MKTGILLGCGVTRRGKLPKEALKRVKKALLLLEKGEIDNLVLSGKFGSEEKPVSEAELYKEYLLERKVNKKKLFLEEESRDTIGNAVYSKKKILENDLSKNIVVITSNYHLKRALMIFKYVFGKSFNVEGVPAQVFITHRFLKKLGEFEKREADLVLLYKARKGDHLEIESIIRKHIPFYN